MGSVVQPLSVEPLSAAFAQHAQPTVGTLCAPGSTGGRPASPSHQAVTPRSGRLPTGQQATTALASTPAPGSSPQSATASPLQAVGAAAPSVQQGVAESSSPGQPASEGGTQEGRMVTQAVPSPPLPGPSGEAVEEQQTPGTEPPMAVKSSEPATPTASAPTTDMAGMIQGASSPTSPVSSASSSPAGSPPRSPTSSPASLQQPSPTVPPPVVQPTVRRSGRFALSEDGAGATDEDVMQRAMRRKAEMNLDTILVFLLI
nr:uncharacterized protein LOC127323647 [Lolium perenne]